MQKAVTIGTRGSKLALWQANFTKDKLEAAGYNVTINVIKTRGDKIQHLSFDKIEGKGFFTKEIEDALLNNDVDLAVHSCKDLPTESPDGLTIAAYSARAAAQDVLLIRSQGHDNRKFLEMIENPIVGTSSARRKAQLIALRSDVDIKDIRGNVPTRINKLREGQFDAILLAAAGLDRLKLDTSDLIRIDLDPIMFVPAPAQGILAYQIRSNDDRMMEIVKILNDEPSKSIIDIERNVLNKFQGGCQMPLGVYAIQNDGKQHCWVSEAESSDTLPKRMKFDINENVSADSIVNAFRNYVPKSVFITKNLHADSYFKNILESASCQVSGNSFLSFNAEYFNTDIQHFDWIFFASKNGVKFFFDKVKELPKSIKIAAINKGSAQAIKALGYTLDFIGEGGSLEQIANDFDNTEGKKALFVRAKVSNRSIQSKLSYKIIEDLVVYDNFANAEIEKRVEDILVFTSPMNVEGYFSKHKLQAHQKLVAIGPSSEKAINNFGYNCKTAFEPTMWSILDEVFTL